MPELSPNLDLALLVAQQADAHVIHNAALRSLDALVMGMVKDRDLTDPPGTPAAGDRYIPKATATGIWAGRENNIALYYADAWYFLEPVVGWTVWVEDEKIVLFWDGTSWKNYSGTGVFAAYDDTGGISLTGTWSPILWRDQLRYDTGLYTHTTGSNQDQITLKEPGDYLVMLNLTAEITGGSGSAELETKLTLDTSDVLASFAVQELATSSAEKATVSSTRLITASAGQVLRCEARRATGTATVTTVANYSRVTVQRV